MQILRSHDKITVDQKKYIKTVLQQFNMSDCKAVTTPGEVNLKQVKSNEEQKLIDPKLYRSPVGSLLFIGKQARPDILHIVNQLSRFLDKPESHWKAAKYVLRYLNETIDLRLTFLKNSNSDIGEDNQSCREMCHNPVPMKKQIDIGEDNQSCIKICHNPVMHKR